MMRQFVVLVGQGAALPLGYAPAEGEPALCTMEVLAGRGRTVMALTSGNGIEEQLSLEQMRAIYGDDPRCARARERGQAQPSGGTRQGVLAF